MGVKLFPHNQKTYEKIKESLETNNRVAAVQPTGTGKSFLYLKWIEDNQDSNFVLLAPSLEIFTQLQGYAVADPNAPTILNHVEMISYQALLQMEDSQIEAIQADKIILDEFHRVGAEQWGPSVQKLLKTNSTSKVLGATATPIRYLDEGKDMATELFDSNLAVNMSLGEAIAKKILPEPRYIPVWYDYDDRKSELIRTKSPEKLKEKFNQLCRKLERSYGAENMFKQFMPNNHGKYIVFCKDKEHLAEMIEAVPNWLHKVNTSIHSYISISALSDKDKQMQSFKADNDVNSIKLLFTINRFNEGVHVDIDGVILLRPTTSPIIYLQQIGRAFASKKENPPLIFDMVNNYQNATVPSADGTSINVFESELKEYSEDFTFRIFGEMVKFSKILEEMDELIFSSFDERWMGNFDLLKAFKDTYNRFPCPGEKYGGIRIGDWVRTQKENAKKELLSETRYNALRDIGLFETTNEAKWDYAYNLLRSFISEFGRLPKDREKYKGFPIGQWSATQKHNTRDNPRLKEHYKKLQALGLYENKFNATWEKQFQALVMFKEAYGRFPKCKESYNGVDVGIWLCKQTEAARKETLHPDRMKKLQSLGCAFETRSDLAWDSGFQVLQEFIETHGRFPRKSESFNGKRIGLWIQTQKALLKKEKLPDGRYEKLKKIGLFATA